MAYASSSVTSGKARVTGSIGTAVTPRLLVGRSEVGHLGRVERAGHVTCPIRAIGWVP